MAVEYSMGDGETLKQRHGPEGEVPVREFGKWILNDVPTYIHTMQIRTAVGVSVSCTHVPEPVSFVCSPPIPYLG